jgi:hypothetical protein
VLPGAAVDRNGYVSWGERFPLPADMPPAEQPPTF